MKLIATSGSVTLALNELRQEIAKHHCTGLVLASVLAATVASADSMSDTVWQLPDIDALTPCTAKRVAPACAALIYPCEIAFALLP